MALVGFNLRHIEAFLAVVDLGTFRRAAERLNTSQPNISNRISQLERFIGNRILDRDAGSVRLTPKGQALVAPAREILAAVDGFLSAAGDEALFEGVLRLGVSEMVAHTWLRPFMVEMKARFPGIDVELTVDLSASLSKALLARDLDLTFQSGPFEQPARCTVLLGQSGYVWVAAPNLGIGADLLTANEFANHAILTHSRGTVPQKQLDAHLRSISHEMRLVSASNIGTCLHMALDGLGIACLPEDMIGEPLADGRLQRLTYGWQPDDLSFAARYVVEPEPPYLSEAVKIAQKLYPAQDNKS